MTAASLESTENLLCCAALPAPITLFVSAGPRPVVRPPPVSFFFTRVWQRRQASQPARPVLLQLHEQRMQQEGDIGLKKCSQPRLSTEPEQQQHHGVARRVGQAVRVVHLSITLRLCGESEACETKRAERVRPGLELGLADQAELENWCRVFTHERRWPR